METAADVFARNNQGQTPYSLASSRGYREICGLLLEYREHHAAMEKARTKPPAANSNVAAARFETTSRATATNYYENLLPLPPVPSRSSSSVQTTPSIMPPIVPESAIIRNGQNSNVAIDINGVNNTSVDKHGFIYNSHSPFLQDTNKKPLPSQYRRSVTEPLTLGLGLDLPRPHTIGSPPLNGHSNKSSPVVKHGYKVLPKDDSLQLKVTPEKSLLHLSESTERTRRSSN